MQGRKLVNNLLRSLNIITRTWLTLRAGTSRVLSNGPLNLPVVPPTAPSLCSHFYHSGSAINKGGLSPELMQPFHLTVKYVPSDPIKCNLA